MSNVAENLAAVNARVNAACLKARRSPSEITLLAVSKTQPAAAVREAYAAGHRAFGENYAQELRDKARELVDLKDLRWHFIGPLQSNKVKYVAGCAAMMHTVDRLEIAQALHARLSSENGKLEVLLEVNVGDEESKHGLTAQQVPALLNAIHPLSTLKVVGLMCIPPAEEDAEKTRPHFAALRALAQRVGLSQLSMGMSHDFEIAVEEGATIIRVGTAIFGQRMPRKGG